MAEYYGGSKIRNVKIGWVDTLISTKQCTLCQYLVRRFTQTYPNKQLPEVTNGRRFFCYAPGGWATKRSETGMRLNWNIWIKFQEYDADGLVEKWKQNWEPLFGYSPSMALVAESVPKLARMCGTDSQDFTCHDLARIIPRQWDPKAFKAAFQICLRHHGKGCEAPRGIATRTWRKILPGSRHSSKGTSTHISTATKLRVVDVHEHCIINLPNYCKYFALSYCWSRRPYLCLTKENFPILQKKGGIDITTLAPTIADALQVTAQLSERYIWIDALCIIQDSEQDKLEQIGQMHKVYQGASLTIVAANESTVDLDSGLPRLLPERESSKQDIIDLEGLWFAERQSDWRALKQTRWHSRAWTYQEYLMSKRLLVFGVEQVRFSCEGDLFSEDYQPKLCFHGQSSGFERRECCEYHTPTSLEDQDIIRASNYVNDYDKIVSDITFRQMTCESDILRSVLGLLTSLVNELNMDFLCGLPVHYLLEHFVMWHPKSEIFRRGPTFSGQLFPSWSWAGWVGGVGYFRGQSLSWTDTGIANKTFRDVKSFDTWTMLVQNKTEWHETSPKNLDRHSMLALESCILQFSAPVISLDLKPVQLIPQDDYSDKPSGLSLQPAHIQRPLMSLAFQVRLDEAFAGLVYVDSAYRDKLNEQIEHGEARVSLVEVSRTSINHISYYLFEEGAEYLKGFRKGCEDKSSPLCANVLLVEWEDDIAYRRGAGQVHVDALDKANCIQRVVKLG